jgi:diacylglycerol kinase (ATP)
MEERSFCDMEIEKRLKTFVVHNPVSGLSQAEVVREKISQAMEEHQIPFEIYETTGKEDIHDLVKAAIKNGFERFVAVGGDGTVSGVASGLVRTEIPLVIIPTGTVNALARELQIPMALDDSVRWWLSDYRKKVIDVIDVGGRYYLLNVSVGTSAKIMKEVKREDIHRFGVIVFIWQALKRRAEVPTYRFQLAIDGRKIYFRAAEVVVANSGVLLGMKALQLDADASLDNGKLSVCRVRLKTIFDYARIGLKMLTQPPEENEELHCMDATREIKIQASRSIPVQGDGELIGNTPVTIRLVPHALHLLLPAK